MTQQNSGLTNGTEEDDGSGITRIIGDGAVFEKAGVNFSHVFGKSMSLRDCRSTGTGGRAFRAMGVSLVVRKKPLYCPPHTLTSDCLFAEKEGAVRLVVWRRLRSDSLLRL